MFSLSDSEQFCSDGNLINYDTENSPVYYSPNSRLSSLSNSSDHQSFNEFDVLSKNDSFINFQTESTPICFSHHSPISPLSLDLSYEHQELESPFGLSFNKLNLSNQLLNRSLNHVNNLNKHDLSCFKENKLSDKQCETTGYLSGDCSDEEKSSSNNDGFKDDDNDDFYVNTCISLGHSLLKEKERFLDKISQEYNHLNIENKINIDLSQKNTIDNKEDILRPQNLYSTSRTVFKAKQNNLDYDTTISNFSKKFISRSMYKIDGKESGVSGSIVNGSVIERSKESFSEIQLPSNKLENSKTKGFKKIIGLFKKTS